MPGRHHRHCHRRYRRRRCPRCFALGIGHACGRGFELPFFLSLLPCLGEASPIGGGGKGFGGVGVGIGEDAAVRFGLEVVVFALVKGIEGRGVVGGEGRSGAVVIFGRGYLLLLLLLLILMLLMLL